MSLVTKICPGCNKPVSHQELAHFKGICYNCYQRIKQVSAFISNRASGVNMPFGTKSRFRQKSPYHSDTANIVWKPEIDAYECEFPYKPEFIEFIKAKVPSGFRTDRKEVSGSGARHLWYFSKDWLEDIILPIMNAMYPGIKINMVTKAKVDEYNQGSQINIVESQDKVYQDFKQLITIAIPGTPSNGDFEKLGLKEIITLYRKACLYYHPDRHPEDRRISRV